MVRAGEIPVGPRAGAQRGRLRAGLQTFLSQDLPGDSIFPRPDVDLVRWQVLGRHYLVSRSPRHIEHVFIEGHDRYRKAVHYRLLAAVTGEGLLTSEGIPWAR